MPPIMTEIPAIAGALQTDLRTFVDDRGHFTEVFRKEWFPQRNWDRIQMNRSKSQKGVLRGLHYHFHQIDYWFVVDGRLRIGLADLRQTSPTYKQTYTLDIDPSHGYGIYIPSGVAHGFLALTDVTLIYVVDNYYDGADELGLIWNDPDIGVDWGTTEMPILSSRDLANPRFGDIAPHRLPQ